MLLVTEPVRALLEIASLPLTWKYIKQFNNHDEHQGVVVTLPGFFGADGSMAVCRKYLTELGYDCYGWNQGRNFGLRDEVEESLEEYVAEICEKHDEPVRLIGHSLGGLYARELAKKRPDLVSQVITLGSPFNHPEVEANVPSFLRKAYELLNGEMTEVEHDLIATVKVPPECPTHCFYSKMDGVVHYTTCFQDDAPANVENLEVFGSHAGMGHNPLILYLIGARLLNLYPS